MLETMHNRIFFIPPNERFRLQIFEPLGSILFADLERRPRYG